MTQNGFSGDVRRQAGWLPASQDALEDWLAGHRQRVEAKGDIELHPAVVDFQRLIASDPVVGMYVSRMIAEVPETRSYSKRHLEDPAQLLRLINEVLTMAPEFGDQNVTLPLGAILDWTMGTPAGFAAFRDPKVNEALMKILTAWCDYLNSPASLYVLNDSPSGWTSDAARRAIGPALGLHVVERLLYPPVPRRCASRRRTRGRRRHRRCLRVHPVQHPHQCEAPG
jgi:phosphatidylserine decarboxylase